MHVEVGYPAAAAEREILGLVRGEALGNAGSRPPTRLSAEDVFAARDEILNLHMASSVQEYLVQLVLATRTPGQYDTALAPWLEYGASPRGTIALDQCSRAHAWLQGRDFATPDDVRAVAHDVLRHRVILSFEAEADGVTTDEVIDRLLALVPAP